MRTKRISLLVALVFLIGAMTLPMTAFAAGDKDTTPPTLTAVLDEETVKIVSSDDNSGVEAVYIDKTRVNSLVDGKASVSLKDYAGTAKKVSVYAVDYAGTLFPANAGERVAAVVQQGVHERAVRVAGRGVDDHAARFVDDDDVAVLIHHVERYVLGCELRLLRFVGEHDRYDVALPRAVVFP